ncbi:Carboxymethylenebutenolidase [Paraburkholderia caffeinitolerans]|uniref:Carboxymethylenebutenolidase n=1 Tax=Paraburkholderia caffeinitolerans TaxID=1723730 RepID=A0A6J5GIV8_9BURK|nr:MULTISPECIES: dienelactone hydrolase family protein [Paraburkholderia]CAB3799683.1 Carboxymethylenebutenolidase [Paraburkholderia caffeinitolerans]
MSVSTKWIDIPAGKDSFGAYLALPKGGKGPGIVIIQEIFGVNGHIRDVVEQYALDGYVAIAPDIFWRTAPRVELDYVGADRERGIELMKKTDMNLVVEDIAATAATVRQLPECSGKVAAIGYCLGGRLAYLAAASGSIDAAVSYYGGGIHTQLDLADKIKQPMLFHYAELDHGIPLDAVGQVKERFAGRDNAEFHLYPGADHGFNCSVRASYNQNASALAHGRTLAFLAQHLQ